MRHYTRSRYSCQAVFTCFTWQSNKWLSCKKKEMDRPNVRALLDQLVLSLSCQLLRMVAVIRRWERNAAAHINVGVGTGETMDGSRKLLVLLMWRSRFHVLRWCTSAVYQIEQEKKTPKHLKHANEREFELDSDSGMFASQMAKLTCSQDTNTKKAHHSQSATLHV